MLQEKPKNDLDMRYRLNSKGQREGKVIDYRLESDKYKEA
jgi:protein canopy 1/2